MTSTEQDLHDLLDRTMRGVSPDVPRLHDHAVAAGRRLRRRRRLESAALAATAVAVVAAVAFPLAGGSDGAPTRGVPAASTGSSPSSSPVIPEEPTAPFVERPGWWDMPVGSMRSRLQAQLPEGVTIAAYERRITDAAPGQSTRHQGTLLATLADADGEVGSIEVMLIQLPDDSDAQAAQLAHDLDCDPSAWHFQDLEGAFRCDNDDPDSRLVSYTDQGVTYHEARRRVGDGEIYVAVANSTERKWTPPVSAEEAPLRLGQVAAIAADESWTSWVPRR